MKRILVGLFALFIGSSASAQTPTPLVVTAASVVASDQATVKIGTAGASITAGQLVYLDTDGKYKLADADGSSATGATVAGMALHTAASGQPLKIVVDDPNLTPGATLVAGVAYALSPTAGGLTTIAGVTGSGAYVTPVGIATSTSKLFFRPVNAGAAIP